ncbi:cAMP-binding domain of CRP or a regulatory subunit of cAMP-dependent protein kinases [Tenacibaculum sp. MAR_2009_124]|uniref:Crp/Fnr family transcriptional regulator n=1 Tax=Tenacibaculum sp. MAR_2009_124 TaxID=1250059 RepID=UPI00089C3BE2|nr:Crp/Fnr family transcriptional regulator [Tenacibaculum sp. MAR_2009_124]SEC33575.1 cAMP-binding domain of CRP or a regulatory subunit of cAMP-dependent protein kinases [Tenacibaculum sp. MAR_2009_124]
MKDVANFRNYLFEVINDNNLNVYVDEILEAFSLYELPKDKTFVEVGEICKHFCFVESGILQHSITVKDEDKTTYLALKNSCTTSLKSFLKQTPSSKNIKALSKCQLKVVKTHDFQKLMQSNIAFKQFYYNLIENQIFLIDDYRLDLLTLQPEDRYKKLLINEPDLLNEVPLHYLASFLGISKRHMSRIRKNVK